jgi:hypothetical protein
MTKHERRLKLEGKWLKKLLFRREVAALRRQGLSGREIARRQGKINRTAIYEAINESEQIVANLPEAKIVEAELVPEPRDSELIQQIYDLRVRGMSYEKIAQLVNRDRYAVARLYQEEIKRVSAAEIRDTDALRRLEIERLDAMQAQIWSRVMQGELEAAAVTLKILERRSKLLGLDAPTKIDMEHRIRVVARELGYDEEEAVQTALQVYKQLEAPQG